MNWCFLGIRIGRSNNILYLVAVITGLAMLPHGNLAVAEPVASSITNGAMPEYVARIIEMPFGSLSQGMKNEIRHAAQGRDTEAVAFALAHIHGDWRAKPQDAINLDVACIRIMESLQEETLTQFKEVFASKHNPDIRLRRALVRWARSASSHEVLCFTVDALIQDREPAEDIDPRMEGNPRRLCDAAYNLALDRIKDATDFHGKKPIATRDPIAKRDDRLAVFKSWWDENKAFLEWSDTEKKFVVNQEAKKAAQPETE